MDARKRLPKKLRNATPEEIAKYRTAKARKATSGAEEARQLFRQRMEREGRLDEYDGRIAVERELGKSRRQATYAAMREMGYKNAETERRLYRTALARGMLDRRRENLRTHQKRRRKKMRDKELDQEFDKLPDNASNKVELAWVRSHPKMMHAVLARLEGVNGEEADRIKLTVEDITSPSNGHCPSKSAFTMLGSWLEDPKEFRKQLIPEQRKGSDKTKVNGDESEGRVVDVNLLDVKRMLAHANDD